ncbi:formate dehydrogenase [Pseudooceanicola sp. 216_PA32_1]|uniref:Formate dehydrogenase n=1 Tax=Pseudooceanicola pacificus TaxID=2676438 RepID=A0A844W2Z9_9RHOB|nr:formate dehydrogenase subunit delta [Pseudooceanicola pacificus]MWB78546.1 formate dehydrogenase [Pseudooceanicola pacificus]
MSPEKLVYMANQIATFFATQPGEDRAERVAAHLSDFWEPRMRVQLLEIVAAGGAGLSPLALEAAGRLPQPPDGA